MSGFVVGDFYAFGCKKEFLRAISHSIENFHNEQNKNYQFEQIVKLTSICGHPHIELFQAWSDFQQIQIHNFLKHPTLPNHSYSRYLPKLFFLH
jgi:hypothetical protein